MDRKSLKDFFEMLEGDARDIKEGMCRYQITNAEGKILDIKNGMRNAIARRNELRESGEIGLKIARFD